jgi:hypothetical protein
MRGKLWFIGGLAAGFVLGARAGREKYEELVRNARMVWDHPTVQEAAGVAQAQANRLYAEGKDRLAHTKVGEKLTSTPHDTTLAGSTASPGGSTSSPGTNNSSI